VAVPFVDLIMDGDLSFVNKYLLQNDKLLSNFNYALVTCTIPSWIERGSKTKRKHVSAMPDPVQSSVSHRFYLHYP